MSGGAFSDYAEEELLNLYNHHGHEVGTKYSCPPGDMKCHSDIAHKKKTNCITYVINVLTYAFEKAGRAEVVPQLKKRMAKGTEVAKYLVDEEVWAAAYFNPDVNHPRDGAVEHPYSYRNINLGGKYYGMSVDYRLINYSPTNDKSPHYKDFTSLKLSKDPTPLDTSVLQRAKIVQFGFGMTHGGYHTWLFSRGFIYEVHYNNIGPTLYEKSPFESYGALSGVIVFPPDALWL